MRARVLASFAAVTLCFAPVRASAQSASDQAAAEALFKQARDLMGAGHYDQACPKFAESQRLDPAPGTLLNLATCYEREGRIASAWVSYKEAATAAHDANQEQRARLARHKAAQLEPKLPMLTIVVPPAADRPDLQVKRDGEVVGRPEWGTPIPVDPGPHVVEASAAGKVTWKGQAQVDGPAAKASIDVPPLEDAPVAAQPAPPAPAPAPASAQRSAPRPETATTPGSTQRVLGLVVAGVGVAGLAVGSIFGLVAKSNADTPHCNAGVCDGQAGLDALVTARTDATVSTIAFIAGGAALVGGAVLFLTAPHASPSTGWVLAPGAAESIAGLTLRGTWR